MRSSGLRRIYVAALMTLAAAGGLAAQGVTTSAVSGRVTAEDGTPLAGVQVVIINEATAVQRGTLTREDGRFFVPGLRPGGPYRVEAQMIGYRTEVREGLQLALGEVRAANFTLRGEAVAIEGLDVVAERVSRQAGVASVIDERAIQTAPTLGRDIADFTRLTPQAYVENDDDDGPAISIAGQNNRYNSIFIDGAVSNDVFGLSAQGTNGGQTGATPISMDAIEEFQIAISPFDVTQSGFTGGAINAITRSGTNELKGSFYYQLRNESLAGLAPLTDAQIAAQQALNPEFERSPLPEFKNARAGFRLGGPIIKNKLFFFANAEILRSETPQPFVPTEYRGDSLDRMGDIRTVLTEELGYDPGEWGDKASRLDDNKVLAKLDWNIGNNHRLSARHSYSHSDNVDEFGSGSRFINFRNNAEVFPNRTHATAVELNSTLGAEFSNKLIVGFSRVRDDRDHAGNPFPMAYIRDGAGELRIGSEQYSTANVLNQDIFTITNNVNWFRGRHSFTFGTHNEFYSIANLFIPFNFGRYYFRNVDQYIHAACAAAQKANGSVKTQTCKGYDLDKAPRVFALRGYSLVGDRNKIGDESENIGAFDAFQVGFYAQDDFQATDRLRLTAGLRVDIPKITTKPRFAPDVFDQGGTLAKIEAAGHDLNGARPGETPAAQLYFQPRLGFSYDLADDAATVVRGGVGVFTGRVPFVWPGGMFLNNGANTAVFAGMTEFIPNPVQGPQLSRDPIPSGRLEIFEKDFRYPSVLRTSAAVDRNLPWGLRGSLEAQYTKTLSNILVTNVNLNPAARVTLNGPDKRQVYAATRDFNGDGKVNGRDVSIDPRYSAIHRVGSTSEGYTYDVTARLSKDFNQNLYGSLAFTFGDAYSINDGTSSQINSIWAYHESVNGSNFLDLSRSDFSIGQRVLGQIGYRKEFFRNLATTVSAIYTGESGRPFSYTIGSSNDMLGEPGGEDMALLFVPKSASDLTFVQYKKRDGTVVSAAQQQSEFEEFIAGNEYLSSRRGQYAERNGSRTPFESVIDLRIAQEIFTNAGGRLHRAELGIDIFNFTNLLNKDWGRRYRQPYQYDVLDFEGFADGLTPEYTFRLDDVDNEQNIYDAHIADFGNYSSRWQMQVGIRYTF